MRAYGLGKGTVLGILEEHGVKLRGQGITDDRLGEAIELYRSGTVARVTGHRQQPLGGGQHGQQLGRAVSENTDASPCGLERTSPQSRSQAKWAETVDCTSPRCAVRSTTQTMSWESGAPRPEPERPLFTYDERGN
jgi:hypothetical protein